MLESNIHEQIAKSLLNIDRNDFSPGQDLLDEGKWITYDDPLYPDYIIKEYPDGQSYSLKAYPNRNFPVLDRCRP